MCGNRITLQRDPSQPLSRLRYTERPSNTAITENRDLEFRQTLVCVRPVRYCRWEVWKSFSLLLYEDLPFKCKGIRIDTWSWTSIACCTTAGMSDIRCMKHQAQPVGPAGTSPFNIQYQSWELRSVAECDDDRTVSSKQDTPTVLWSSVLDNPQHFTEFYRTWQHWKTCSGL